jgi:hypothetical protein
VQSARTKANGTARLVFFSDIEPPLWVVTTRNSTCAGGAPGQPI